MTNKPKILMIGRHGKAPQLPEGGSADTLVDETITQLYDVGVPLSEFGFDEGNSVLAHTKAKRTRTTGEAVLAGAFGYKRPETVEQLAKIYDGGNLDVVVQDNRLNLRSPQGNMTLYKKHGAGQGINFWLANPDATEHEGEKICPYNNIEPATKSSMRDAVRRLVSNDNDLGVVVTHASMVEPCMFALVNSARKYPVDKVEDIGGILDMAEFGQLKIEKSSGVYKATLNIKGQDYAVDLNKI